MHRAPALRLASSLVLCCALGAPGARAAGFYFPDLGARQLGRGGTGVADPGDLSALVYNPAGLAALPGAPQLFFQLGGSLAKQPLRFQRAGGCGSPLAACAAVEDSAGFFPNTVSGAAADLGLVSPALQGLVVALGIHGPSALGTHRFPDPRSTSTPALDAPQRYSLIESEALILYPGVAAAWRALPWLDLGASLELRWFHIRQSQSIFGVGEIGGDYPVFDAIATFDATQSVAPVFGGGVIVRPPFAPGLSIGLSGRAKAAVSADGTLAIEVPPLASALNLVVEGRSAHLDLVLPSEARLGASWTRRWLTLAAEATWEGWGALQAIKVTPLDVVLVSGTAQSQVRTKVDPIVLAKQFHGAFSGRFGGEAALPEDLLPGIALVLRAGAIWEGSAIPDETLQVDFVDGPRLAGTLGFTARRGALALTVGWGHCFQSTRTVATSTANRVNPYPGAPPFIVGNGQYTSSLDALAAQLTWSR